MGTGEPSAALAAGRGYDRSVATRQLDSHLAEVVERLKELVVALGDTVSDLAAKIEEEIG